MKEWVKKWLVIVNYYFILSFPIIANALSLSDARLMRVHEDYPLLHTVENQSEDDKTFLRIKQQGKEYAVPAKTGYLDTMYTRASESTKDSPIPDILLYLRIKPSEDDLPPALQTDDIIKEESVTYWLVIQAAPTLQLTYSDGQWKGYNTSEWYGYTSERQACQNTQAFKPQWVYFHHEHPEKTSLSGDDLLFDEGAQYEDESYLEFGETHVRYFDIKGNDLNFEKLVNKTSHWQIDFAGYYPAIKGNKGSQDVSTSHYRMNCIGDSEQCSTWNQPFLGDEHAVLWSAMKPADGRFGPIVTCHVLLDGATVEAVKGFLTEKPETTMGDLITFGQSRFSEQEGADDVSAQAAQIWAYLASKRDIEVSVAKAEELELLPSSSNEPEGSLTAPPPAPPFSLNMSGSNKPPVPSKPLSLRSKTGSTEDIAKTSEGVKQEQDPAMEKLLGDIRSGVTLKSTSQLPKELSPRDQLLRDIRKGGVRLNKTKTTSDQSPKKTKTTSDQSPKSVPPSSASAVNTKTSPSQPAQTGSFLNRLGKLFG